MSHHSPTYAITIRLRYPDEAGQLGRITSAIGEAAGFIGAVDIVNVRDGLITRDITVNATDVEHGLRIIHSVKNVVGVSIVNVSDRVFLLHLGGKIEIAAKTPIKTRDDLSMAYTPGVARVCRTIFDDPEASFALTIRKNTVAVVTDGSAVLGMGNIGPRAALPVMEGKALLFKEFGGVDAFPICLDTQDTDQIVETVCHLAPSFGGINLEDISAPRCIEIEERLISRLDIPVFHDDQHGTAIVVLAGLKNALKVVDKTLTSARLVINGAGAAGIAITKLLAAAGAKNIVVCDRSGAIFAGRSDNMNSSKQWLAEHTNPEQQTGILSDIIRGADVFVGVSSAGALRQSDVASMAQDAVVFALANPDPEIRPEDISDNVRVMATGRSDYPNQVNNVLCFPGLFRGVLDVRASRVNDEMKLAAADAIAGIIEANELHPDYIIPSVFDRRIVQAVAKAVSDAALATGVARRRQKPAFQIA
ncbi:MAG: NAD-dependent malic enzyme [Planctomycetota bacterium]|nr:NAD-dependent malic enzyme [Planctomycetota bacterium]